MSNCMHRGLNLYFLSASLILGSPLDIVGTISLE